MGKLEQTKQNLKISLRKATEKDIPDLISVEKKLPELKIYSAAVTEKDWKEEFDKKDAVIYLILKDGVIVGDVSYEKRNKDKAHISGLAIDPNFQGMGIGREAVKLVLKDLKGVKVIELATHPDNEKALKLYSSFGFARKGIVENYFGDGEPRILMIREK